MRPYDIARKTMNNDKEFYNALKVCGEKGVIISTDEVFVCAYQTYSSWMLKNDVKELDILDSWYIWLLAGNPKPLFGMVQPKKYIIFERFDDKYRLYKWDRLFRRYNG